MTAKEPVTTKFKVDISDLKRGITEANNTIKKANAQFNAATSGMDDWASSADGVKEKLKQLDSVLEAQKAKLSNYQQQFDRLSQAEKENAKRAEELKQKYQQAAQQFGENSKEAQQYKTALNQIEKEQQNNANAASKLEVTILNQQAAIGKIEKEARNYNKTLEHLGKVAGQTETAVNDLSGAVQDTSDGFTTLKGTIASAMGALVADKIKGFIGELKSFVLDGEESLDKFQAATGLSAEAMGEFEEQILDLYKNNYGESIDDVAESMAKVKQVTKETDPSKLQEMTKYAINLRDTFGSDFDESIRGINNLMYQFDLTAEEAFDMFAKGSQAGLDYTDELGDNVAEYSGNFKQAGYSANEYFQLLENGTSNGAYNLDKVNDAINEVKNKLADGSIEKNLGSYSKDTQKLFKEWQHGKGTMKDVIDSIVKDINNCTNESDALTMAATAFGTMGEDSNLDFIKSLTSVGDTFKDVKGTMEDVDQTRWDNTKSQMVSIGRSLMVDVVQPLLNTVVPALNSFGGWFKDHVPEIISLLTGLGTTMATVFVANKIMEMVEAYKRLKEASDAATLSQVILNKVQYATPALMIASLIAGLAAALITYSIATRKATGETDKNVSATDKLVKKQKELDKTLKENKSNREEVITSAKEEGAQSKFLYDRLTKLMSAEKKSASQKREIKDIVSKLNELMPELNLKYDAEKDSLNKSTEAIYENIEAQKSLLLAKAGQKNQEAILEDIASKEIEIANLTDQNTANEQAHQDAVKATKKAYDEWMDAGGKAGTKAQDAYIKAYENEEKKKKAYDNTSTSVKKAKEDLADLNKEYDKTNEYVEKQMNTAELESKLAALVEKCKAQGVKIPDAVKEGILSGQYKIPETVNGMKNLISFADMAEKAGLEGVKIPSKLAKGISSGKVSAETAIKTLKNLAKFDDMAKKAGVSAKEIPKKIKNGITSDKKSVSEAMKQLNAAMDKETKKQPPKMKQSGEKSGKGYNEGVKSQKKGADLAGKTLGDGTHNGTKKGIKGLPSLADTYTGEFSSTIRKGKGKAGKAGNEVGKTAKDKLKSGASGTDAIGGYIVSGVISGVANNQGSLFKTLKSLAKSALDAAKDALGIHSPSTKFRDIIGKNIISGIVAGITGSEKTLLTTMKNTMSKVLSAAKAGLGGQFAAAGSNAAELFSNAIQGKLDYLSDKVSYTFEVKMGQYDSKISSLESKLSRREKYDEKLKSLKSSKKYKNASKKERQKMIKALQKQYKDVKGHTQKYYKDYIKFYEKQQDNYKNATDKALTEFNDAMSRFGSQAEQLVSDTINGITDTYQNKWDNLINLQDSMVQKLQGFGDLFTVSGAGVMTVNDIKAQTDEIKAYMERLNSMKGLVSEDLFNQIASYDVDQGKAFMDQLLSMSAEELKAYNDAYTEKMNLSKQLSESLYKSDFDKVSAEYKDAITQAFKSLPAQLEAIAKECMKGFTTGLKDDTGYLSKAIQSIANDIINQFKDELDIHSPSKVFASLGGFSAEGYGQGFIQQMRELKSSLVASVPMQAIARASGVTNYKTNTSTVNQTFNQYNNSPKALSRLEIYRQTKNALNFAKGV